MLGATALARPVLTPLADAVARARAWPVASQQQARRNAMVAATHCAQRRVEREEVADFLVSRPDLEAPAPVAEQRRTARA